VIENMVLDTENCAGSGCLGAPPLSQSGAQYRVMARVAVRQ
jgi:hypothetical protein